jgi:hypothetical protein
MHTNRCRVRVSAFGFVWFKAMPSFPIDILLHILEHVKEADLLTICLLNRICCSCAQDVLYRNILVSNISHVPILQTLTDSTHLAKRVRSFQMHFISGKERELLRIFPNMINLRHLRLGNGINLNVLEGCTSALASFTCFRDSQFQQLHRFLARQPSVINFTLMQNDIGDWPELGVTCLPNLTRVDAPFSTLSRLIPNRPVKEVTALRYSGDFFDLSFFTLSTSPIQKLVIHNGCLYPKSGEYLASIFPSLTHLSIDTRIARVPIVCEPPVLLI